MKVAIASGKGGVGKTLLATNLSSYLSESMNVVLCDLDVEEPNSGLFISGDNSRHYIKYKQVPNWNSTNCTLCGNCQKVCNFHAVIQIASEIMVFPELCHSCYACSELCPTNSLPMIKKRIGELSYSKKDKLHFIESRLDIGEEQAVPLISQTHKYVEANFSDDVLQIFDSPPGTSCPVIEAVKNVDFVILITEPTPMGLHDLVMAVETMRELKKDFCIVINRWGIGDNNVVNYCYK